MIGVRGFYAGIENDVLMPGGICITSHAILGIYG